jgi:hypothetical protein
MSGRIEKRQSYSATNYLNASKRRIFHGARGGFHALGVRGKKVYGIKAHFRKVGGSGNVTNISNMAAVPSPIRRKVRSNKGVARGPREGTMLRRMAAAKPKKTAAKNVMVFSPGGTLYKSFRSMMALKKRPYSTPTKRKVKKVSLRGLKNKNPYNALRGMNM